MARLSIGLALWLATAVACADPLAQGDEKFRRGQFTLALAEWQAVEAPGSELQWRMARAYRYLGRYSQARDFLQNALRDTANPALLHSELSALYLAWNQPEQARLALEDAELQPLPDAATAARLANQAANLLSASGRYEQAEALYAHTLPGLDGQIAASLAINRADNCLRLAAEQTPPAMTCVGPAWAAARQANQAQALSYQQVLGWVRLAQLAMALAQLDTPLNWLEAAQEDLEAALQSAARLENPALQAEVAGTLGRLHELRGEFDSALRLTRQAVFWGPEAYRWQWQLGRLLARQDEAAALTAYRRAVGALQPFRFQEMRRSQPAFQHLQQPVSDLYLELVDLLLRQAGSRQSLLEEARQVVEQLNLAELQDYFDDPCVTDAGSQCETPHPPGPGEAVLYPILLPQRLALLAQTADGLQAVSVEMPAGQARSELLRLVGQMRTVPTGLDSAERGVCPSAQRAGSTADTAAASEEPLPALSQRLYRWLFAPIEAHLRGISHITVVPTGPVRLLPFASLYDGEKFLVQRYTFSSAPTACLAHLAAASPASSAKSRRQLLAGLSQAVQGFPSLPCVSRELEILNTLALQLSAPAIRLLDGQFTHSGFARALAGNNGGVVHIASHGSFKPRGEDSFILTYDKRLTLAELDGYLRNVVQPPELLTLSACETALGDDYAVLGLAGVAVRAGVNSALASLWRVDDEASTLLMQVFYQQWLLQGRSKAQALQAAQRSLLESPSGAYRHPYYWAAFALIGGEQ